MLVWIQDRQVRKFFFTHSNLSNQCHLTISTQSIYNTVPGSAAVAFAGIFGSRLILHIREAAEVKERSFAAIELSNMHFVERREQEEMTWKTWPWKLTRVMKSIDA